MKAQGYYRLLLFISVLFACKGQTQQTLQVLHGHVRPAVLNGQAAPAGLLSPAQRLNLSIVLPLRNQAALTSLLGRLYDPSSSDYRHFLSVDQFAEQFGPTAEDYQAVVAFARANGLTVTGAPANRMTVPISGTVDQINKVFHVSMKVYQHPTENRSFYSPDREPSLNLSIPVSHIAGLSNFSVPRPMVTKAAEAQENTNTEAVGSGPGGSYLASDMRAAYYGGTALTGSGQAVGLVEFDGYAISDVASSFDGKAASSANGSNYVLSYTPKAGGITYTIPVNNVLLDGATGAPCQLIPSNCADAEQALDIVQAVGLAPGLSQIRVYIGATDADILNAMASEDIANQLSISWTWSPDDPSVDDAFFLEFAAQGQSLFAASGDDGAFSSLEGYYYPAEDGWVTAVGGTDLVTNGAGGAWSSETAWTDSGGGISPDGIPIPSWQAGVATSSNGGSTTLRNVPDVAMEADTDNYNCNLNSCQGGWGGTSFAAPRWAGFTALINQQAANSSQPDTGFINPAIYELGQGTGYGSAFHDITIGNNDDVSGSTFFYAVAGYDLVTGWGSPNGQNLINALAGPQSPGFWLSASPASLTINPSTSVNSTITVEKLGGFSGSVTLSISGLPSGITASFATNPTTGSSMLTLTAASTVLGGSFPVTVTGVSGTSTATALLALDINAPASVVTVISPAMPQTSDVALEFKPGTPIPVVGTVVGSFQNLSVEWAAGINPASGWTASGIVLSTNLSSPVTDQTVATWDTSSITSANYYTIRVSVVNANGTFTGSTIVYLEPSLLSSNWPKWVSNVPTFASGVVPVNLSDGNQILAWASDSSPSWLWLSSPDGSSVKTVAFTGDGELYNPSAGSLDGMPGEEVATGVGNAIDVFEPSGDSYATFQGIVSNINAPHFYYAQVVLDDVNGDSLPETLALEENLLGQNQSAYLHVWRGNGAEVNTNFPIAIADQNGLLVGAVPRVLTGDFAGDGNQEILVIAGTTSTTFTPLLFNANGTAHTWHAPTLNGNPLQIALADLDGNGELETIMIVNDITRTYMSVYVLQPDGTVRSGWPVTLMEPSSSTNFTPAYLAVGDLNQNGHEEIVVSDGIALYVLNSNGLAYSSAWPLVAPTNSSGMRSIPGPVVLADINGDGLPEIVTTYATAISNPALPGAGLAPSPVVTVVGAGNPSRTSTVTYFAGAAGNHDAPLDASSRLELRTQLVSFDRNGNLLRAWNLLGANSQEPCNNGVITVGDFNQDGMTDIAVSYLTVSQQSGETFYCMAPGMVTVLTTGASFKPAANDWPMINQNPQNTAVLRQVSSSTVSITSSANPSIAGQQIKISAVVSPVSPATGTPTGVVNLLDGGQNIGSCQLSSGACSISSSFTIGTYSLVLGYVGDTHFASSTSAVLDQVVEQSVTPVRTTTVLSIAPSGGSLTVGTPYTLTATVTPSSGSTKPTGNVVFTVGSANQTVALNSSGVATYNGTAPTTAGGLTISAAYQGSTEFSGSTSNTLNETVVAISTTTVLSIVPNGGSLTAGASYTLTATVTPSSGSTKPTGNVVFTIGSANQTVALNSSGVATYNGTAPTTAGGLTISAAYQGSAEFSASTSNTLNETITVPVTPSFTISGSAVYVSPGATSGNTSTITVAPAGGFTGSVALTASITSSPNGAEYPPSLSFGATTPVSVTGASSAAAVLTISTTASTLSMARPARRDLPWYASGGAALACLLLAGLPVRRRCWRGLLGMMFLLIVLTAGALACGGGGGGGGGGVTGNSGTTAGIYTITVSGSSVSATATTTVNLTVE